MTPAEALAELKTGNARFASGSALHPRQDLARVAEVADGQQPFAAILACSDSRQPLEILLDQGIGDIFVVRNAGNIASAAAVASLEYALEHLQVPLLLLLGHTHCGAVTVAARAEMAESSSFLAHFSPAIAEVNQSHPEFTGEARLEAIVTANVFANLAVLLRTSVLLRHRLLAGTTVLEGAVSDLETGAIRWLGRHPQEAALLAQEVS